MMLNMINDEVRTKPLLNRECEENQRWLRTRIAGIHLAETTAMPYWMVE